MRKFESSLNWINVGERQQSWWIFKRSDLSICNSVTVDPLLDKTKEMRNREIHEVQQTAVIANYLCGTKSGYRPALVDFLFISVLSPPFCLDCYILEVIIQSRAS